MTDPVLTEAKGSVLTIRLNRPEKKNAISLAMYEAMTAALKAAAEDPAARVAVIRGGEDFSAGNDIADFLAAGGESGLTPIVDFLDALSTFPKPLVAGVRGAAIGIGTTLLLHCDVVLASATARFQLPFIQLGLVPEAASSLLLPAAVGRLKASWWLLTGEGFDADAAFAAGLITKLVADETLDAELDAAAAHLAALPPAALRQTKALLRGPQEAAVREAMTREVEAFGAQLKSAEAREAFTAFLEKRKPDFSRFG
ncbi:enoyl-CoA hydratase-related protein [Inquilinus sp. Marseille-Q2685]|uniref:enoyl-CoA hydratase-related protein n=1 Tax=Inquilinus sp. Marseille-Q2685 TaxID=2866581 RepID=UPI001CE43941|nr:enoyl-CoA hydratase-related protein [Inquilinus sp. Marseille-Q2685]